MKLKALAIAAALAGVFGVTAASAAPQLPKLSISQADTGVEQVQVRRRNGSAFNVQGYNYNRGIRRGGRNFDRNRNYRNRGYRSGPRGWNRYSSRPRNYRSRGCIIIGPVWYCP